MGLALLGGLIGFVDEVEGLAPLGAIGKLPMSGIPAIAIETI